MSLKINQDHELARKMLTSIEKTESFKTKGNDAIKAKKFQEAKKHYTDAIEVNKINKKLNAILYSNRALANMRMNLNKEAVADCDKSIELDDKYTKSYIRRAEVRLKLEEFNEAVSDYWKIKEIDPSTSHEM